MYIYQCLPIDFFAGHGQVIGKIYHLKTDKPFSNTLNRLGYIFSGSKSMVMRKNLLTHGKKQPFTLFLIFLLVIILFKK